jgi:aminoglycoside phosphotransferase (APT) family kinase protein
MAAQNMPEAEVEIDTDLVGALLRDQHPDLATRSVTFLANGWDNAMYRIGDDLIVRLPRRQVAVRLIEHEWRWLPSLAAHLPLPIPAPIRRGEPSELFPWPWTIVPWIDGEPIGLGDRLDHTATARALGEFLRAMHRPAPAHAPVNAVRGIPLPDRDEVTQRWLDAIDASTDVRARWDVLRDTTPHAGPAVWLHGDLHPLNILVTNGVPTGVIDFGDLTSGDPATDLSVAWLLFDDADHRALLVEAYGGRDDDLAARAEGWALALGVAYVANGADHPVLSELGHRAIARVMAS